MLSLAHETRWEIELAIRAVERAVAMGGPDAPLFRARLAQLRAKRGAPAARDEDPLDGAITGENGEKAPVGAERRREPAGPRADYGE